MLERNSGIILPKTHPNYDIIEHDLNRIIYGFNGKISKILFYRDLGDSILIPRMYPVEDVIDNSYDGDDIDIQSNIVPRNKRQEKAIEFLLDNDNGVLSLEPASGKTVVSIAAISKIKKRTIIFAHKKKLLEQWKKEILRFTNLKNKDIGKLSTRNFKKVFKKKIILCTEHVIPIAIKNDKTEFMEALENAGIGIMIVDEVHIGIGPETFSMSSLHINCKRTFGLSATPTRGDGNDDIINYHLGEVTYLEPGKDELLKPKIFLIHFKFGIYGKYRGYLTWGGNFSSSRYLKQMFKVDRYNDVTSKLIKKCYDGNKTTLVLGDRINSLIALAKKCKIQRSDIGIFIPGASSKDRLSVSDTDDLDIAFNTKKVVFSTYKACRDGNNREDFDCLIHATPSSNVEQSIGRIQRPFPGKCQPVVIDLIDMEGPLVNSYLDKSNKVTWFLRGSEKRIEIYEKHGWEMKSITLGD
jgi:hypothetical protein